MFALSGLVWALYMTLLNRWRVNPVRAAIVVAVLSTVYLPFYWLFSSAGFSGAPSSEVLLQAGYQGIAHALIAVTLFGFAVRTLGTGLVALMTPIVPAAGLMMAGFLLDEGLSEMQWFGAGLVCCAMLLATYRSLQSPASS